MPSLSSSLVLSPTTLLPFDSRRLVEMVYRRGLLLPHVVVLSGIYEWLWYRSQGLLSPEWDPQTVEPDKFGERLQPHEEGVARMLRSLGLPKHKHRRRHVRRFDESKPLGPDNALWDTVRSRSVSATVLSRNIQRSRRVWRNLSISDPSFYHAWPALEDFQKDVPPSGFPFPEHTHATLEKIDSYAPWAKNNVRWVVKESVDVPGRPKAYQAWYRDPEVRRVWPVFNDFFRDVGPSPEGKFRLSRKDPGVPHGLGNTTWVEVTSRVPGKESPGPTAGPFLLDGPNDVSTHHYRLGQISGLNTVLRVLKENWDNEPEAILEIQRMIDRAETESTRGPSAGPCPSDGTGPSAAPAPVPARCPCSRGNIILDPPVGLCLLCVIEAAKKAGAEEARAALTKDIS